MGFMPVAFCLITVRFDNLLSNFSVFSVLRAIEFATR